MKVSIAVPSYNYARFLPACLDSIARQDHGDFEVLIADGGSTDDSVEIIRRYEAADTRFRLVSTRDAGQADAVQKAFSLSEGEVFCFLNADDCYTNAGTLRLAVEALSDPGSPKLVSFRGVYIDETGALIKPVRLRYHPFDSLANLPYRASVLQPATFWRREVQEQVPFRTDFHYCFDALFFWEAWRRFAWAERSEVVAGYRLHGSNKSMQVRSKRVAELASFERLKFGPGSWRAAYLSGLSRMLEWAAAVPGVGRFLLRGTYLVNNALSFATFYRLPGI